eukprot:s790_g1.t1
MDNVVQAVFQCSCASHTPDAARQHGATVVSAGGVVALSQGKISDPLSWAEQWSHLRQLSTGCGEVSEPL